MQIFARIQTPGSGGCILCICKGLDYFVNCNESAMYSKLNISNKKYNHFTYEILNFFSLTRLDLFFLK